MNQTVLCEKNKMNWRRKKKFTKNTTHLLFPLDENNNFGLWVSSVRFILSTVKSYIAYLYHFSWSTTAMILYAQNFELSFTCNSILECVFFFTLSLFFSMYSFWTACYLWQTHAMPDLIFKPNWKLFEYLKCSFWLEVHEAIFIFSENQFDEFMDNSLCRPMMNCACFFYFFVYTS